MMIGLDDNVWGTLEGGYRVLYDASVVLKELEGSDGDVAGVWDELWENLFHQNDVGVASYAAVPHIVRIYKVKGWFDGNLFMFAATIERARNESDNPEVPEWLVKDYQESLHEIVRYGVDHIEDKWDYFVLQVFLMLVSLLQGEREVADLLNMVEEGQAGSILENL